MSKSRKLLIWSITLAVAWFLLWCLPTGSTDVMAAELAGGLALMMAAVVCGLMSVVSYCNRDHR